MDSSDQKSGSGSGNNSSDQPHHIGSYGMVSEQYQNWEKEDVYMN